MPIRYTSENVEHRVRKISLYYREEIGARYNFKGLYKASKLDEII